MVEIKEGQIWEYNVEAGINLKVIILEKPIPITQLSKCLIIESFNNSFKIGDIYNWNFGLTGWTYLKDKFKCNKCKIK